MATAVARVLPDVMAVQAEIVVPVDKVKEAVARKDRAGRVVMVRDRADTYNVEVVGVMNDARCPKGARLLNRCLKSTPQSFLMKKAWSHWHVR